MTIGGYILIAFFLGGVAILCNYAETGTCRSPAISSETECLRIVYDEELGRDKSVKIDCGEI